MHKYIINELLVYLSIIDGILRHKTQLCFLNVAFPSRHDMPAAILLSICSFR